MVELSPIMLAGLTGVISGLLLSIPVGPINLTILNEGARRGFRWAALIGLGATTMEVVYCFIAFTGFASFFTQGYVKAAMELFSFVFMLVIGVKFMLSKSVQAPVHLGAAADRIEERIEQRLHPHSAFMTGFVRTMANPGVVLGWIVLGANFISRGWVEPNHRGKLSCLAGVAVGVGMWFFGLSWASSLGHKKITERGMLRLERGSGVVLLGLGLAHGVHLAWQLTKRYKM